MRLLPYVRKNLRTWNEIFTFLYFTVKKLEVGTVNVELINPCESVVCKILIMTAQQPSGPASLGLCPMWPQQIMENYPHFALNRSILHQYLVQCTGYTAWLREVLSNNLNICETCYKSIWLNTLATKCFELFNNHSIDITKSKSSILSFMFIILIKKILIILLLFCSSISMRDCFIFGALHCRREEA